jgi:hypothetical protein
MADTQTLSKSNTFTPAWSKRNDTKLQQGLTTQLRELLNGVGFYRIRNDMSVPINIKNNTNITGLLGEVFCLKSS